MQLCRVFLYLVPPNTTLYSYDLHYYRYFVYMTNSL